MDDDDSDDSDDDDNNYQRPKRQGLYSRVSRYSSRAQLDSPKSTSRQVWYKHNIMSLSEGCKSDEDNSTNTDDDSSSDSNSYSNDDSGVDEGSQFLKILKVSPFNSNTTLERSLSDCFSR